MKKTIVVSSILIWGNYVYAQGQINFKTHIASDTPPIDFKILNYDGSIAEGWFAQLAIENGGTYTPMDGAPSIVNSFGYINTGVANFSTVAPGATVNMVLRAWQGAAGITYNSAIWKVESPPFNITFAVAPNPPGDLITLGTGSMVLVPEPTTLALGAVGLGILLIRRRKP